MARLPYIDPDAASPSVRETLDALPRPLNIFRMVAHAETAFRPWLRYGAALLAELQMDPVLRELVILHVARVSGAEYEWVQHVPIAGAVGVSAEQVEAVDRGDLRATVLDEAQQVTLGFTTEVVQVGEASAAALEAVRAHLSDRQVIELLLLIGQYLTVGAIAKTTAIELDPMGDAAMLGVLGRAAESGD